jgi:parvulin-like peptidyl-prolyl isomerase
MVRARHILIRVDKSASEETKKKAREKAEDLLKRIRAGEDFAKLAGEFSEDPVTAEKGGDVGFFPKGRMVPEFEKVCFGLKPGEVSDVFETSYGFHIAKVEEKKPSATLPFDEVKGKVKTKLLDDFRKTRVSDFIEKALKDAGVEMDLAPFAQPI